MSAEQDLINTLIAKMGNSAFKKHIERSGPLCDAISESIAENWDHWLAVAEAQFGDRPSVKLHLCSVLIGTAAADLIERGVDRETFLAWCAAQYDCIAEAMAALKGEIN